MSPKRRSVFGGMRGTPVPNFSASLSQVAFQGIKLGGEGYVLPKGDECHT
jgi:hypothetical protein